MQTVNYHLNNYYSFKYNILVSARIASFGRVIKVAEGTRIKLRCNAVGAPPLFRSWKPLPRSHTLTDSGDLLIHST